MSDEQQSAQKPKVGRPRKHNNPAERQRCMMRRGRENSSEIKVFVQNKAKEGLKTLCKSAGLSQGAFIERLIAEELKREECKKHNTG